MQVTLDVTQHACNLLLVFKHKVLKLQISRHKTGKAQLCVESFPCVTTDSIHAVAIWEFKRGLEGCGLKLASFGFALGMILGWLECQFHSCAHVSNLSSVGPPNSTTRKGPDYHHGEDAALDVLPSQKPSIVQIESSLLCAPMHTLWISHQFVYVSSIYTLPQASL